MLRGVTTQNMTGPNLARAAIEAVLGTLAEAADLIAAQGASRQRVLLIGGGARSEAARRIAPTIFGAPVLVPAPDEYVALGAARQAAWALAGTPEPRPGRGTCPRNTPGRPTRGSGSGWPG